MAQADSACSTSALASSRLSREGERNAPVRSTLLLEDVSFHHACSASNAPARELAPTVPSPTRNLIYRAALKDEISEAADIISDALGLDAWDTGARADLATRREWMIAGYPLRTQIIADWLRSECHAVSIESERLVEAILPMTLVGTND